MIESCLIANRGEIACRVIRACRARGIRAVAVYSDADAYARHVREADAAARIGPAPAGESYLDGAAILDAAQREACEAIHPGYGFLSENADFAQAVLDAGLVWVGPDPETIRTMGLKDQAKQIAQEAGVPVLPGYRGEAQDLETLAEAGDKIGYPLLIKAVAGGGGRGIREVAGPDALAGALESARREAQNAFGDARMMLEKLVERPRHIEVQVFGDGAGRAVHMFERDCSLQRRRQKVIEEAPAPGMSEPVRAAMCTAAVRLAEAVAYRGAGTVEFIVDGARPLGEDTFWFLEMNTRLQVEHPVTEMITGLDLVGLQLEIASGQGLSLSQADIAMTGHAIEARICAEDPSDGFRPGAGRIEAFGPLEAPEAGAMRWETGFEPGDRVPGDYDSMLAKLVVHGPDRDAAIDRLAATLSHTQLVGVPGNVGFLGRCVVSEAFGEGDHHVNWIAETGATLTDPPAENRAAALAAVGDILMQAPEGSRDPWDARDGWRLNAPPRRLARLEIAGALVDVDPDAALPADAPVPLVTDLGPERFAVTAAGDSYLVVVPDFEAEAEAVEAGDAIKAPMPGRVLSIGAQAGAAVSKGEMLVVMEAMKMEHALTAPREGTVESVSVSVGDSVSEGMVLVALVAED